MCGIAGILNFNGTPINETFVFKINTNQLHRGKDFSAIISSKSSNIFSKYEGLALGHRRLSIIDLDESASQPMSYQENRYWITYNGELYNYLELRTELKKRGRTFRTNSDTEVILVSFAEWGQDCLHKFDGMFAFAIWDEVNQHLFCARDPIGIKPFYYKIDNNSFSFASESQSLVDKEHLELNEDALYSYVFSMYVPQALSIYNGVNKLLPGTFLIIDTKGNIEKKKYWSIPKSDYVKSYIDEESDKLLKYFDNAVSSQMVSDVPLGAFLSGGFDSGMIVASAARNGKSMHTYSAGYDDGAQFDELPIAKALSNKYGTKHHERIIRSNEIIEILDKALTSMSEPVADSSIVPTYALSEMASSDGIKVLLSGTGGDEVLAGYSRYVGYNLSRFVWNKIPFSLKSFLGKTIIKNTLFSNRLQSRELDLMMLTGGCANLTQTLLNEKNVLNDFLKMKLIDSFPEIKKNIPTIYKNMHFDLQVYVPDLLLFTLDQLTMANTVEGRVPLLNTEFIKACYNLHPAMHVTATKTRLMMRQMAKDRLLPDTLNAKKQGFSGPVKYWINKNENVFKERVMAIREIPNFQGINVEHYWTKENRENPILKSEIFTLFCLSTWYHNKIKN